MGKPCVPMSGDAARRSARATINRSKLHRLEAGSVNLRC